jgi:hypothetical protein
VLASLTRLSNALALCGVLIGGTAIVMAHDLPDSTLAAPAWSAAWTLLACRLKKVFHLPH